MPAIPLEEAQTEQASSPVDPKTQAMEEDLAKAKQREQRRASESRRNNLIMKLDPTKLQKKDKIFMEFFAMYGKNFAESKKH
eukprot:CAMPEP_0168619150 /NCGR_PEP_ID=MMETSP0449_2-20121227/6450_1 /TAXON_ID=1082188 /ORGANISM="Strombidium rassoulzadegani, Strain ras09" /LENGTH=81 /DNA_ID=CAMNT_0008660069 /DNA_START=642 /DNA_END=887 /DNA_ORIENTATION=+